VIVAKLDLAGAVVGQRDQQRRDPTVEAPGDTAPRVGGDDDLDASVGGDGGLTGTVAADRAWPEVEGRHAGGDEGCDHRDGDRSEHSAWSCLVRIEHTRSASWRVMRIGL
jgi:hypothetical protein